MADTIDRNINITIFVYVPAERFKGMFYFEIAWRMVIFEARNNWQRKQLTKPGGNKVLRSRPRAAMFVLILNHARYPANPRLIEWCLALEPRRLTEILLYWASSSLKNE